MKHFLFSLVAVALAAASCKKETEADALPKATQAGLHTFGCLVDGKAFGPTPPQGINSVRREPLEASIYLTDLFVSASGEGYVYFALRGAFQPGTYPLGETRTGSYGLYQVSAGNYDTNATHTGTVTLTRIDTVARIAAGTFQFTAFNHRNGQTVTVTEGRFDVRLR